MPAPDSLATRCVLPHLDRHHRAFIALSPFLTIASSDRQGGPDVSPRGDVPGFVAVSDARTLVIPDRPGNKKLLTLTNVVENASVALIFLVPGRTESLRVNGTARITTDPVLLAPLAMLGKSPLSALIVAVEIGLAALRPRADPLARLWDEHSHLRPDAIPSLGQMLADQIRGVDEADAQAQLERAYDALLWSETPVPS